MKVAQENKLDLNLKKRRSLLDFVSTIPAMVTKSATRDNIQHGFLENSLIDSRHKRYPDFIKILSTRKKRNLFIYTNW